MTVLHKMTLNGLPFRVNPEEMRWNFQMKVADQAGVTGKVIQILGLTMSDLTIKGRFSPDRSSGDREAADQAERFRIRMRDLARKSAEDATHPPVRLTYPPRGWDFDVYVKAISEVNLTVADFSPTWQLTLFPVGEGVTEIVRGIKDLYIKRLMDGIGWKQTDYNGPMTQDVVDQTLGGLTPEEYVVGQTGDALAADASTGTGARFGF